MRPFLYVFGILLTLVGILETLSTSVLAPGPEITSMLVVVCGVMLFSTGAIVSAIESLRAPAQAQRPMPPQAVQPWPAPEQGVSPGEQR